jgi:hypothetical protein
MGAENEISQTDFERKLRILSIVVPLIICIISSVFAPLATGFVNSLGKIPSEDLDRYNALSEQISYLSGQYYATTDPEQRLLLDDILRRLADDEAEIMQKYNPEYLPRWPVEKPAMPMGAPTTSGVEPALDPNAPAGLFGTIGPLPIVGLVALFVVAFFASRPLIRRYLRSKYTVREPVRV